MLSGRKTKLDKLDFLQKVSIPNGVLVSLLQSVFILALLDDISTLGPNLAVCILVLTYSMVVYVAVTILKARCKTESLD